MLKRYYGGRPLELGVFRGREVDPAGEGFVASCRGPARGGVAALAVSKARSRSAIDVRVGMHTGECEMSTALDGVACHCRTGLDDGSGGRGSVSQTVKDWFPGSGLKFSDEGTNV